MKDLMKELNVLQVIAPQATIDATTTFSEIDISGAKGDILFSINLGVLAAISAANTFTMTVNQAIATGGSFAAAASTQYSFDSDFLTGLIDDNATAGDVLKLRFTPKVGYAFLTVTMTEAGTASALMSGTASFEDRYNPV